MGADAWPLLREACLVLEDVLHAHNSRETALVTSPGALGVIRASHVALGHHEALFSLRVLNRFVLEGPTADVAECRKAITKILGDLRRGMQAQDARLFARLETDAPVAERAAGMSGAFWLQAQGAA